MVLPLDFAWSEWRRTRIVGATMISLVLQLTTDAPKVRPSYKGKGVAPTARQSLLKISIYIPRLRHRDIMWCSLCPIPNPLFPASPRETGQARTFAIRKIALCHTANDLRPPAGATLKCQAVLFFCLAGCSSLLVATAECCLLTGHSVTGASCLMICERNGNLRNASGETLTFYVRR